MIVQKLHGSWELAPVSRSQTPPESVSNWLQMDVPSHWQMHPELRNHAGFTLYRKRFSYKAKKGARSHLVLPGIFYYSSVFLNGRRLGDHEGYFTPQRYDITDVLAKDNELVIEVHCPDEKERNNKRMITGVFSHWDCLDPTTNPGGIWLAPEIHTSGGAHIDLCLFQTDDLDGEDAHTTTRLEIVAQEKAAVKIHVELIPIDFEGKSYAFVHEIELDEGHNTLAYSHILEEPSLWWTHDRGRPNLYSLKVTIKQGRKVSDVYEAEVGIRTVHWDNWIFSLNGQRLYLKGNNQPPTDTRLATVTYEDCERDIRLAKQANLNILRVHAHVDHPDFYRAADREGLLLWQDFPLQWSYRREILPIAQRMIADMGRGLFNHPSIAIWCCHNEPIYLVETDDETPSEIFKTVFTLGIWGWNRDVLDPALKDALAAVDPTRFVNEHSGKVWLPWQKGTDTHFYFGWYRVQGRSMWAFDRLIKRLPKNLVFNTEFGAQSLPNLESCKKFMAAQIENVDWAELEYRHSLQKALLDHWVGLKQPDLATLIEKSQNYQSEMTRHYIDRFRRVKYAPNGGVMPFMFTDPNPAIQWSVLDYWRKPKKSYFALQKAMRPVYAFVAMDRPIRKTHGKPLQIEAYVVNDTLEDLGALGLTLTVTDASGSHVAEHHFSANVGPDSPAIHLATIDESPESPGTYTVTISIDGDEESVNIYTFQVE
ncbi:MAG: glycoside hydrolase family 2 TIM barrel-domain containing protein [Candidatus Lernaella stagnicola]|nr:glycoside hydrolase family 2 TIM barrel-domain containing protein [Candidatus Lernaella stagnicola]